MPVAVECPQGHRRAYAEADRGNVVNCPVAGCGHPVNIPPLPRITNPCYQTIRLIPRAEGGRTYSEQRDIEALDLFQLVRRFMHARGFDLQQAVMEPGSYSIRARTTDETAGKIVIYEQGRGRPTGQFPPLADGVYVWVRADDQIASNIWDGVFEQAHPRVFRRLAPNITLGVHHPQPTSCQERFAYFLVPPNPPPMDAEPTWDEIARFLAALSQL